MPGSEVLQFCLVTAVTVSAQLVCDMLNINGNDDGSVSCETLQRCIAQQALNFTSLTRHRHIAIIVFNMAGQLDHAVAATYSQHDSTGAADRGCQAGIIASTQGSHTLTPI